MHTATTSNNQRRKYIGLFLSVIIVAGALIWLSPILSATAKTFSAVTAIPGRLANAPHPGVYTFEDYRNLDPNAYPVVGGHMNFNWNEIEPEPNLFRWDIIDGWIASEAAKGKTVGFAVNTYKGNCCGGDVTPAWVYKQHPEAHILCSDYSIPKYWDPAYQDAYRNFVAALAARYDGDPRVSWLEISVGMYGETWPAEHGMDSCLAAHGLTSDLWVQTVDKYLDFHAALFHRTALLLQMAPAFKNWYERKAWSDHAGALGIGLKHNGLMPDQGIAYFDGNSCAPNCGAGWAELMNRWQPYVPIGFESYRSNTQMTDDKGGPLWAVYNALDKHADYLVFSSDTTANPVDRHTLEFANRHLGRTLGDTPSVWVALRDTDPKYHFWFPQHGNYNFWLQQDDAVPGGDTVPEYSINGGPSSNDYKHGYGRYCRRTDGATNNHFMYFKVNDGYIFARSTGVTFKVMYYDKGWDSWELQYDGVDNVYHSLGAQHKTNSLTWKTATFHVDNAFFANREAGGSDFRLWDRNDGNEYVMFVQVIRDATQNPTPTVTPTATSTSNRATLTATPTLTPTPVLTALTLEQGVHGYNGFRDTYIDASHPSSNFDNASSYIIQSLGSSRALLRFDLPALPNQAILDRASLQLFYESKDPPWYTLWLRLYDLRRGWNAGQATWQNADNGHRWTEAGANNCTYDRTCPQVTDLWLGAPGRWYSFDITDLVQRWLSAPASNYGVLIQGWQADNKNLHTFLSSGASSDPYARPKLVLYYHLPTPTPDPSQFTATPTATDTAQPTATGTSSLTPVVTYPGPTYTPTPTFTASATPTATPTPTNTPTPTSTPTPTNTPTPTTVALQQGLDGYDGQTDTYLYRWQNQHSYGQDTVLVLQRGSRRALLRFDLAAIPVQAQVFHAELKVYLLRRDQPKDITVGLSPLRRAWVENEATWSHATAQTAWQTAGAQGANDVEDVAASTLIDKNGGWVSWDVTSLVRQWVRSPQSNDGVLMDAIAGDGIPYTFYSAQRTTPGQRPQLVITYAADVVPPTATPTFIPTATPVPADLIHTITWQDGHNAYQGFTDTYINAWYPDLNYGHDGVFYVRSGNVKHGLIRFDTTSLPAYSHILTATLNLYESLKSNSLPLSISLYPLSRSWQEKDATWYVAGQTSWQVGGAGGASDRKAQAVSAATINESSRWVSWNITAMVQRWADQPDQNNGFLLLGDSSGGVEASFISSDWLNPDLRPRVDLSYIVIPPTPTPTNTPTPIPTDTPTPTFTPTATFTSTPTWTWTPSNTPQSQATSTPTPTWTLSPTPVPPNKQLNASPSLLQRPRIDGDLSEWSGAPLALLDANHADTIRGVVPSYSDFHARLWASWDETYLYFAVAVTDNVVVANDGGDIWRDDGIEFGIDGANDHQGYHQDDHQITIRADGLARDFGVHPLPNGVLTAAKITAQGYNVEMALPWSALGDAAYFSGRTIGFTFGAHDDDDHGDWDSYLIWAGDSTNNSNSRYAALTLIGTPPPPLTPTPTATATATAMPLTLTLQPGREGYTGLTDSNLDLWLPNYRMGSSSVLSLRSQESEKIVLRFALPGLPAGSHITSADLELFLNKRSNTNPLEVAVYNLLRTWVESEVTWQDASTGVPWGQPGAASGGADRGWLPAATVSLHQSVGWVQFDVTNLVSNWAHNPGQNHGVVIEGDSALPVEYTFLSREWINPLYRPRLIIHYHQ